MEKMFVTTIKEGWATPYLGAYDNEISVNDFAETDKNIELINFNAKVKNLHLLPHFKSIKYVGIDTITPSLVELLTQLPNLQILSISGNRQENWPALKSILSLKYIILYNIKKLSSLEFLRGMTQLESLFLSEVLKLNDISALETTPNIRELALEGNLHGQSSVLPNVDALFTLKKMEYLNFFSKKTIFNAADFSKIRALKYLRLSPRRYPFEFYAELERYLPESCERIHTPMFTAYLREACEKCGSTEFLMALGSRQREFCPTCNKKKLDKLLNSYETLSGKNAKTAFVKALL